MLSPDIYAKVKELSLRFLPEIIAVRRHLHSYPELSFQEYNTTAYIRDILQSKGYRLSEYGLSTGLIADLNGRKSAMGYCALRADIDALPITEANDCSYRSKNEGVMHACGHDVHTACLVGAMAILHELEEEWGGRVRCIFQPGEEKNPGGATLVLASGALDPAPQAIFGLHVHPSLPAGEVGIKAGMFMASSDEITLHIYGRGGHAALPELCIDPLQVAANILTTLPILLNKIKPAHIPAVLSFGQISSLGGTYNVIPDKLTLLGTFRTMNEDFREKMKHQIHKTVQAICFSFGARAHLDIATGYPCLFNEEKLTSQWKKMAQSYLSPPSVTDLPLRMTSEDFAFYSRVMPGCFFRLGTGSEKLGTRAVHTPFFDIEEDAMATGMALMALSALHFLEK